MANRGRQDTNSVRPFLKWVGGKQRLVSQLTRNLPKYRTYFEPLLGGGALFFALKPKRAVLSDANEELINCFTVLRDGVDHLVRALQRHRYDRDHYYEVREQRFYLLTPVQAAARTIYLNKTGFNGLYRVNRDGLFNVPFGRHSNPTICDEPNLRACSAALRDVEILHMPFEQVCRGAKRGDLVYFDPPFIPLSQTADFTSYTPGGFGCADHYHLAGTFIELAARGCHVMLSNSDTKLSRKLYRGYPTQKVEVGRTVGCKDRGSARELIIRSFRASERSTEKRGNSVR